MGQQTHPEERTSVQHLAGPVSGREHRRRRVGQYSTRQCLQAQWVWSIQRRRQRLGMVQRLV